MSTVVFIDLTKKKERLKSLLLSNNFQKEGHTVITVDTVNEVIHYTINDNTITKLQDIIENNKLKKIKSTLINRTFPLEILTTELKKMGFSKKEFYNTLDNASEIIDKNITDAEEKILIWHTSSSKILIDHIPHLISTENIKKAIAILDNCNFSYKLAVTDNKGDYLEKISNLWNFNTVESWEILNHRFKDGLQKGLESLEKKNNNTIINDLVQNFLPLDIDIQTLELLKKKQSELHSESNLLCNCKDIDKKKIDIFPQLHQFFGELVYSEGKKTDDFLYYSWCIKGLKSLYTDLSSCKLTDFPDIFNTITSEKSSCKKLILLSDNERLYTSLKYSMKVLYNINLEKYRDNYGTSNTVILRTLGHNENINSWYWFKFRSVAPQNPLLLIGIEDKKAFMDEYTFFNYKESHAYFQIPFSISNLLDIVDRLTAIENRDSLYKYYPYSKDEEINFINHDLGTYNYTDTIEKLIETKNYKVIQENKEIISHLENGINEINDSWKKINDSWKDKATDLRKWLREKVKDKKKVTSSIEYTPLISESNDLIENQEEFQKKNNKKMIEILANFVEIGGKLLEANTTKESEINMIISWDKLNNSVSEAKEILKPDGKDKDKILWIEDTPEEEVKCYAVNWNKIQNNKVSFSDEARDILLKKYKNKKLSETRWQDYNTSKWYKDIQLNTLITEKELSGLKKNKKTTTNYTYYYTFTNEEIRLITQAHTAEESNYFKLRDIVTDALKDSFNIILCDHKTYKTYEDSLKNNDIKLVLLDLYYGKENLGPEIIEDIKKLNPSIKILVLSKEEDRRRTRTKGIEGHIIKTEIADTPGARALGELIKGIISKNYDWTFRLLLDDGYIILNKISDQYFQSHVSLSYEEKSVLMQLIEKYPKQHSFSKKDIKILTERDLTIAKIKNKLNKKIKNATNHALPGIVGPLSNPTKNTLELLIPPAEKKNLIISEREINQFQSEFQMLLKKFDDEGTVNKEKLDKLVTNLIKQHKPI